MARIIATRLIVELKFSAGMPRCGVRAMFGQRCVIDFMRTATDRLCTGIFKGPHHTQYYEQHYLAMHADACKVQQLALPLLHVTLNPHVSVPSGSCFAQKLFHWHPCWVCAPKIYEDPLEHSSYRRITGLSSSARHPVTPQAMRIMWMACSARKRTGSSPTGWPRSARLCDQVAARHTSRRCERSS